MFETMKRNEKQRVTRRISFKGENEETFFNSVFKIPLEGL